MSLLLMDEILRKLNAIHRLIELQDDMFRMGGIAPSSQLYSLFLTYHKDVLRLYNLRSTPYNRSLLFIYPYSYPSEIPSITPETVADISFSYKHYDYCLNGLPCLGYPEDNHLIDNLALKVRLVHWNLMERLMQ